MLFVAAIVTKPTPKEIEEGKQEELLWYSEVPFVARDIETAKIKAVQNDTRDGKHIDPDKVMVLVRPFA